MLRGKPESRNGFLVRILRLHGFTLRLAGCFLLVALATGFAGSICQGHLIWLANGVMLAYLFLAPRRSWPCYLCAGLAGHLLGSALIRTPWPVTLEVAPLDLGEVLLSALLLRRRSAQLPRFTQGAYLLRFLAFAVLAAPLATAQLHALLQALCFHAAFAGALLRRAAADGLGVCVVTPACVAIFRTRLGGPGRSGNGWLHLLPVAAVTFAVLSQAQAPLPFLLYPLLILVLLRFGLGWAAMTTLFAAAAGSWFTVRGQGPFASSNALSPLEPAVILQLFVASAMFMLYSVSVVLENLRARERRLLEIAALHKLVTENSRDVIVIADFEGNRSFVSGAIANWGGWSREDLLRFKSFDLAHPDDRPKIAATILELRAGKDGALVECRVRTREGRYLWVEASLRTIRDPVTGLPKGILNAVREITQRKLAEQELADAYHAVETLAITDALTGLANRHSFDQCINNEWRRCMRERKPLSLLLVDADLFKSYNDSYGHLRGDSCLKQIAEAAQDVIARPGDLVARFGGDEFAVILPNTAADGALQIARDICAMTRNRQLPHSANTAGIVTVSVGCATLVPQFGHHAASLIDCADKALYQAKRCGHNHACNYQPGVDFESADTEPAAKESGVLSTVKTV